MRMYLRRQSRHMEESPTWPALVDLFAFGMAIMIVLAALSAQLRSWQEQVAVEKRRKLDVIIENIVKVDESLRAYAIKDTLSQTIRFEALTGGAIRFDKSGYKLKRGDLDRLGQLARTLETALANETSAIVAINGTADPDSMQRDWAPSDNVELSALRAAAVARVFRENAPHLTNSKRVQVVGLGEVGVAVARGTNKEDKEREYAKYRTVRLEVRADANKWAEAAK